MPFRHQAASSRPSATSTNRFLNHPFPESVPGCRLSHDREPVERDQPANLTELTVLDGSSPATLGWAVLDRTRDFDWYATN